MFGFSDYAEYRTHEQEVVRRAEQSRVAREQAARRQVARQRGADRAAARADQAKSAGAARPRVA